MTPGLVAWINYKLIINIYIQELVEIGSIEVCESY